MRNEDPLTQRVPPLNPSPLQNLPAPPSATNNAVLGSVFAFPVDHFIAQISEPLRAAPELVSAAVRASNWDSDYALAKKYASALEMPTAVFFSKLKHEHFVESDSRKISNLIAANPKDVYCGDWKRETDSDNAVILKLENRDVSCSPRTYQLVTTLSKPSNMQDHCHQISSVAGDTLVLQEKI